MNIQQLIIKKLGAKIGKALCRVMDGEVKKEDAFYLAEYISKLKNQINKLKNQIYVLKTQEIANNWPDDMAVA